MDITQILQALQLRDWYAVAAFAITVLVQLHRKYPWAGAKLWSRIPDGWRFVPPLVYGAAIAFVASFDEGKTLAEALQAALGGAAAIGFGSMGLASGLKESAVPWDGGKGGTAVGLVLCLTLSQTGCSSSRLPAISSADAYQAAHDFCAAYPSLPPEFHTKANDVACAEIGKVCPDIVAPPPAVGMKVVDQ